MFLDGEESNKKFNELKNEFEHIKMKMQGAQSPSKI